MSMGRREFLALVPRGSRFGRPLLTRDRRRSLQRKHGLDTRGVLLRNVDVKCRIAWRQVTLHGNTNDSRKQPLAHIGEAHCQPADPLVLKPATHTGDSVQRTAPGIGQFSGFEGVRAADVGEGPLGNLIGAKLCSGDTGMPMAVIA